MLYEGPGRAIRGDSYLFEIFKKSLFSDELRRFWALFFFLNESKARLRFGIPKRAIGGLGSV